MKPKIFYRSTLPHLTPVGASFFVTFRLADALPQNVIRVMKWELDKKIASLKEEKPKNYLQLIRDEKKRFFGKYDHQLDKQPFGGCALKKPVIAEIVANHLLKYDNDRYELIAYCIMPNHVHMLINTEIQITDYVEINGRKLPFLVDEIPENFTELHEIMRRIKGASAYSCNQELGKKGRFWQRDSYDHYIRNEKEWTNIFWYILNNPVKAKLVNNWEDWKHTYVSPKLYR